MYMLAKHQLEHDQICHGTTEIEPSSVKFMVSSVTHVYSTEGSTAYLVFLYGHENNMRGAADIILF